MKSVRQIVGARDLKVGMRVLLPATWFEHPFLKGRFVIASDGDIRKIIDAGFDEVAVEQAVPPNAVEEMPYNDAHPVPPQSWEPGRLVPDELREAVRDRTLPPEVKAEIVYRSSLTLMERLLDRPTSENIGEAKQGIAEIVDVIVSDDATARNLLAITAYDFYTYTHSVNVGVLSVLLAKALFRGSDGHDMHELGAGFFLHDLGKVRVDPDILNKPGRLSEDEMRRMRTHPYQGYRILRETGQLTEECRIIILQHHEREDGTGYPNRLKRGDIHTYGRICCIADVYDALTAERSYKRSLNPFAALKLMKEEMLSHFEPGMFEHFVTLFS